jgi:tetratricopeptide (TPR) repeat protein
MKIIFTIFATLCLSAVFAAYENYAAAMKDASAKRGRRDFKAAAAACREAYKLANAGQKFSAVFLEGVVTADGGNPVGGVEILRKAMQEKTRLGDRIAAQFHIGYYLAAARRYDLAAQEMQKVAVIAGKHQSLYVDRSKVCAGQYLLQLKKTDEAIAAAKPVVDSPYKDIAVQACAVLYDAGYRKKDMKMVNDAVETALNIKGVSASGFFTARRLAWDHCIRNGKNEAALQYVQEILNDPKQTPYFKAHGNYYAALTCKRMKKTDEERMYWEKVAKGSVPRLAQMAQAALKALNK